jgi:hypothetical protein
MTPSARINGVIELGVRFFHKVIQSDINDPATTFGGNRYETKWLSTFEDDAANPLHFIFFIAILPLGWLLVRDKSCRLLTLAGIASLAGGGLLFCWMLMWQPFHSRQHVALFMIGAPLLAVVIASLPRAKFLAMAFTVILLLCSLPYVLGNETRPLLFQMTPNRFGATSIFSRPREQQYLGRPLPETWRNAAREIESKRYRSVGLLVNWFSCEYPIWLIFQASAQSPQLQHVCVTNMPLTHEIQIDARAFQPDVILRFSDHGVISLLPAPGEITCNGRRYVRTWSEYDPIRHKEGAELYTYK